MGTECGERDDESMSDIKQKIKECKTMKELDGLRMEIVQDEINFIENQKLFIKKKNQLKRVPMSQRGLY